MSSKAKNKSHIKRCGKPACLPVLFTQAHVWGFHRIGPARSLSFPWPNEDRMCALLFCRNVRFSKQWGGEKGQKRAWTCLHVCCVKLVKLVLRLGGIWKGIQHRRKRPLQGAPQVWKGQISCTAAGKQQEPGETARYSLRFSVSLPKLRPYTCIYNYSKYPVFSLSTTTETVPPKQILGLYLDVLTSGITDNGEHNWGHRGKETMREHAAAHSCPYSYDQRMQSVHSQTYNKHTWSQLLSQGLISALALKHISGFLTVFLRLVIFPSC